MPITALLVAAFLGTFTFVSVFIIIRSSRQNIETVDLLERNASRSLLQNAAREERSHERSETRTDKIS